MLNLSKKHPLVFFHLPKNAGKSICKAIEVTKELHPPELNQSVLSGDYIRESYSNDKWETLTKFTVIRNPWDRMVSLYHFRKKENDLLIRLRDQGLWEPKNGDVSQEGWTFKKWLLSTEVAIDHRFRRTGVNNHNVFIDFKQLTKHEPNSKQFFVMHYEYINQLDLITDPNGVLYVDYIIEYENLNEEFNNMLTYMNIKPIELSIINNSSHKSYKEYYDEETKDFVYNLFKKDIDYFNYKF